MNETRRLPGDEAIEAGFDAAHTRLDARAAVADRAALDAVKAVIPRSKPRRLRTGSA